MTPALSVLTLSATPRSVALAREWVADACRAIGRDDVVECAALAVSELVTNAILHGGPPLSLRLGGTTLHPRIEVADGSRVLPVARPPEDDDGQSLTTVGRGLRLVAQCSEAWGTQVGVDGKVVWFVPVPEPGVSPTREPQVSYDEAPGETPVAADPVVVHLHGLVVARYRDFRRHLTELRRELRLLSLAHESDYPMAGRLAERFLLFERWLAGAVELADRAHDEAVDVDLVIDRGGLATAAQLLDVLEPAEDFARAARLLALTPGDTQRAFARWYLGELVDQARGHDPVAWQEPSGRPAPPPHARPAP